MGIKGKAEPIMPGNSHHFKLTGFLLGEMLIVSCEDHANRTQVL